MVFSYYNRLSKRQQRVYRKSDEIHSIRLSGASSLHPLIGQLSKALKEEDRQKTQAICQQLASAMTARFEICPVRVEVLAARPSKSWGELHGLYTPAEDDQPAVISVWMRTAKHRHVVAFKSFLRTVLHELCHHFDYELLELEETFHTEGFYKRESSLLHQLVGKEKKQTE